MKGRKRIFNPKRTKIFLIAFFLLLAGGLVNFWVQKHYPPPSTLFNPLSPYEEQKFLLLKGLLRSHINKFRGPYWNEKVQGIEIFTTDGIKVIFSPHKDPDKQVASLQLILKKYRIVGNGKGKPKVVDLRTLNPYVSF